MLFWKTMLKMKVHRKNTSTLIDRLILPFGLVILALGSISSVQAEPFCYGEIDIVFVIDASFSISTEKLQTVMNFTKKLYEEILLDGGGGENVHAGAIFYASYVYEGTFYIELGPPSNDIVPILSQNFTKAPDNIGTNTADALQRMYTMFVENGRPGTTKVAVLITDGESSDQQATRDIADQIKTETDIFLIALGIGDGVELDELQNIAANDEHAIEQNDLEEDGFLLKLLKKICAETLDNRDQIPVDRAFLAMDIVFLLPDAVMDQDFTESKKFVKTIMRRFAISDERSRIGIIKYGNGVLNNPTHAIQLDQTNSEDDFFAALDRLNRNYANGDRNGVHEGLNMLEAWIRDFGDPSRPIVAVLLTPGSSSDVQRAVDKADILNARDNPDVFLIVIGIGTDTEAWREERTNLAYNDETLFYTSDFLGISGEDETSQRLIEDVVIVMRRIGNGDFEEATVQVDTSRWSEEFDIIIMQDGSKQLSNPAFQTVVRILIERLINKFKLYTLDSPSGGRVGMLLYDASGTYNEIGLGDYQDQSDLLSKIQNLQYLQQTEYADNAKALADLRERMAVSGREGVAKIGFMITFSSSPYPVLAEAEAREVARAGIQLMVVGIVPAATQQELQSLQMFDDGIGTVVMTSIGLLLTNEDQLNQDLQNYASIVRPSGVPFIWRDMFDLIVMVHDESGRISNGDAMRFWLRDLFSSFYITTGQTRVGIITFGAGVNQGDSRQLQLGSAPFIGSLLAYVFFTMDLTPTGGANVEAVTNSTIDMFDTYGRQGVPKVALLITDDISGANVEAVTNATIDMFDTYGRQGVPKVALLITDDISISDGLDATLTRAKDQGINFVAIGINGADTLRLERFASDVRLAFRQPDWSPLQVTTELNAGIIAAVRGQIPAQNDEIRRLEDQCSPKAAIIFLIDTSGSMRNIFEDVKEFVAALMSGPS